MPGLKEKQTEVTWSRAPDVSVGEQSPLRPPLLSFSSFIIRGSVFQPVPPSAIAERELWFCQVAYSSPCPLRKAGCAWEQGAEKDLQRQG